MAYVDGQNPAGGLVEGPDGYLYGATSKGGTTGYGTIYKISKSGQFQKLHDGCPQLPVSCSNGGTPAGKLIVGADGALYGVMTDGGAGSAVGVIYKITTDGVFTKLADFTTATGGSPRTSLLQASDGNFYGGTATALYRLTPVGQLTAIYTFGTIPQDGFEGTNAPMIQAADGNLYGVTITGGANGAGMVFRISLTGDYQKVFDLNAATGVQPTGLVQASDGNLWGTTANTGNYSLAGGTVYTITTAGALLQSTFLTNQTGIAPAAPLIQASDGKLYGTASSSGVPPAVATVFVVNAGLPPPAFTLSVGKAGLGSGTVTSNPVGISCGLTCSADFPVGSSVILSALPAAGSVFAGWSGACSGASSSCSVTMDAAHSVTATFAGAPTCSPRPNVHVSASPSAPGVLQVTVSVSGTNVSLQSVQFNTPVNGLITGGGVVDSAGNTTLSLSGTAFTFTVRRVTAGAATTVPFVITDSCGAWPTFVGGGPSAF